MAIPGPLVHQQLMNAYTAIQTDVSARRDHVIQSRQQREQLDGKRVDTLGRLAEHYLPELTQDSVDAAWPKVRSAIVDILLRQQERVATLQQSLQDVNGQRVQAEQQLVQINQQLEQAKQRLDSITAQVEQTLQQDPRFGELTDNAARAEAALERAEENLAEIDQDAVRKLPAYEQCRLFQYLYRRKYGTNHYNSGGLTRRVDRWLSRYVDYPQARKSYDFLRRTPENMRRIIAEDREALQVVMQELTRRRDEVAEAAGLNVAVDDAEQLQQTRDEILMQLDDCLDESADLEVKLEQASDPRGPFYQQAIECFREYLQSMDISDLKRRASKTAEITDDQIVARLIGIDADQQQLDQQTRQHQQDTRHARTFLEDLGRLIQRFRAAGFDSARSQFVDSFNLHEEVELSQSRGDIDRLWQQVRRAQRWAPTVGDQLTDVATHPLTQVLVNAMAHAAGGALANHARRAAGRRSSRDFAWNKRSGRKNWADGFGAWGDSSGDHRRKRRRR